MFANPAIALQGIKVTKRYGRTHRRTDNMKTVYPTTNKVCGGITICLPTLKGGDIINCMALHRSLMPRHMIIGLSHRGLVIARNINLRPHYQPESFISAREL